jgi:hypothetical protein
MNTLHQPALVSRSKVGAYTRAERFTFSNVQQKVFGTEEKIDTMSVGKRSDALFIKRNFH